MRRRCGLRHSLGKLRKTNVFPEVNLAQESVGFGIGDLERARKPTVQGAVHQRVADEEHKDQRQQRDRHGAQDHLGFEARTKLPGAALYPDTQERTRQDQSKDKQSGNDEDVERIENDQLIRSLRLEGQVQRTERKNGCQKQDDHEAAEGHPKLRSAESGGHDGRSLRTGSEVAASLRRGLNPMGDSSAADIRSSAARASGTNSCRRSPGVRGTRYRAGRQAADWFQTESAPLHSPACLWRLAVRARPCRPRMRCV